MEAQTNLRFVVRESQDPALDLARNWSAPAGGGTNGELCEASEEEALAEWAVQNGYESVEEAAKYAPEFMYHNGLDGFCELHYWGLGAWEVQASSIDEAIEAAKGKKSLPVTMGKGDGHFFAEDVVGFRHVEGDNYIFLLKS